MTDHQWCWRTGTSAGFVPVSISLNDDVVLLIWRDSPLQEAQITITAIIIDTDLEGARTR